MDRKKIIKRKIALRNKRKLRVRGKISGTAILPRVTVFKSNKFFYAQAINDVNGTTLIACDGKKNGFKSTKEGSAKVAFELASKLKSAGIESVVFDRNGYLYHGVISSFVDGLRENGIKV